MIELGLSRITHLLRHLTHPLPWRAFHVAGTNGKGSICAYLSSTLTHSGLRTGRFTSPHLLDRWDCITLNGRPVSESAFLAVEAHVKNLNLQHGIGATEFEVLTATAFEIFSRERVDVAVIEVGIGGRGDATNVLRGGEGRREEGEVCVCVVGKVGMDHEGFLGGTVGRIAWEKAGIMKPGVPVVCDATNVSEVVEVFKTVAEEVGVAGGGVRWADFERRSRKVEDGMVELVTEEFGGVRVRLPLHGGYQCQNAQVAVEALAVAAGEFRGITRESVKAGIEGARWPGRLDWVDLSALAPVLEGRKVLMDGAHNPQAAVELDRYVAERVRQEKGEGKGTVNWVFGATKGKDVDGLLEILLRKGDTLTAVPFGEVDGMPWIRPTAPEEIVEAVGRVVKSGGGEGVMAQPAQDAAEGVRRAAEFAEENGGEVVVAGSLYLIGSLLRQLREVDEKS